MFRCSIRGLIQLILVLDFYIEVDFSSEIGTATVQLNGAGALLGDMTGRFDGHAHVFRRDLPMTQTRRYTPRSQALSADIR